MVFAKKNPKYAFLFAIKLYLKKQNKESFKCALLQIGGLKVFVFADYLTSFCGFFLIFTMSRVLFQTMIHSEFECFCLLIQNSPVISSVLFKEHP